MGCGTSSDAQSQFLEQKRQLQALELKNHEQQNLLRFKVEVLVNMLTVEEKRNELNTKRIETLKWLLYSQGVTEEALTNVVTKIEAGEDGDRRQLLQSSKLIDLSGAMQRMREEFTLFKEEIVRSLASPESKLIPSLPTEEFMRQVFSVTEHISKQDLLIVALRFDDGYGSVNIPEFLDFFATPVDVRTARSAANAVRMSLDLLELDVEGLEAHQLVHASLSLPGGDAQGDQGESFGLDRGARRLVIMWAFVRDDLEKAFRAFKPSTTPAAPPNAKDKAGGGGEGEEKEAEKILSREQFERTLTELCGRSSTALQALSIEGKIILQLTPLPTPPPPPPPAPAASTDKAKEKGSSRPSPPRIEPLEPADVELITERFELHGQVHYGHFLSFFQDLSSRLAMASQVPTTLPAHLLGTSPFRESVEWRTIRQETLRRSASEMKRFTAPRQVSGGLETSPLPSPSGPAAGGLDAGAQTKGQPPSTLPGPTSSVMSTAPQADVPIAPAPRRSMMSVFLCGGQAAAAAAATGGPDAGAQAKDVSSSSSSPVKRKSAKDASPRPGANSDSDESSTASQPKQDSGFHTPRLKDRPRRVQLPPDETLPQDTSALSHATSSAQRTLNRDPLGSADAKSTASSASRFRRRTTDDTTTTSPPTTSTGGSAAATPDASLHQIRQLRQRMDDEEDEDDDDDGRDLPAVSRVHGNVRGVGRK